MHDVITSWLDSHFALIEWAAPWLHRIGRQIEDSCLTKSEREPFSLARDHIWPRERAVCGETFNGSFGSLCGALLDSFSKSRAIRTASGGINGYPAGQRRLDLRPFDSDDGENGAVTEPAFLTGSPGRTPVTQYALEPGTEWAQGPGVTAGGGRQS